jgi:hypothetical protein
LLTEKNVSGVVLRYTITLYRIDKLNSRIASTANSPKSFIFLDAGERAILFLAMILERVAEMF